MNFVSFVPIIVNEYLFYLRDNLTGKKKMRQVAMSYPLQCDASSLLEKWAGF